MTILPRMISIAMRKYTADAENRDPAVRMLLRNAIRLSLAHLGEQETAALARETMTEPTR